MPSFSATSLSRLSEVHLDLVTLFIEVVKTFDCSILCGRRGEAEQNAALQAGKSTKAFPNSKHNLKPGARPGTRVEAVDVAPYPIDWADKDRFIYFAGYVMATADRLLLAGKISRAIKWGGDWDKDGRLLEEKFKDLDHFETI